MEDFLALLNLKKNKWPSVDKRTNLDLGRLRKSEISAGRPGNTQKWELVAVQRIATPSEARLINSGAGSEKSGFKEGRECLEPRILGIRTFGLNSDFGEFREFKAIEVNAFAVLSST
jgi:hypothetical protein